MRNTFYKHYAIFSLPINVCFFFHKLMTILMKTPYKESKKKPGIKMNRLDQNFEVFFKCAAKKNIFLNAKDYYNVVQMNLCQ